METKIKILIAICKTIIDIWCPNITWLKLKHSLEKPSLINLANCTKIFFLGFLLYSESVTLIISPCPSKKKGNFSFALLVLNSSSKVPPIFQFWNLKPKESQKYLQKYIFLIVLKRNALRYFFFFLNCFTAETRTHPDGSGT